MATVTFRHSCSFREFHLNKAGLQMTEILYKDESYRIIGACFEVYKQMGSGFLEAVYQECMSLEFGEQEIPFVAQTPLELFYKARKLKQDYVPDFIGYGKIIVELKSITELTNEHRAQVHNYLKGTGFRLGLLVNFGHGPQLEWQRIVR
jgi:GxxExxY protein